MTRRSVPPHAGDCGGRSPSKGNQHMLGYARLPIAVVVVVMSLWLQRTGASAADVGEQAPDFVMHSTVGESVRLSAYQGQKHVLLFFFPAAFTSV